jgi:REP element-mobilizing transposase RayT
MAMARLARKEMIDPFEVQVVHTVSRCVRRAFLCGEDPVTGGCYEHRRQWIRDRLEFLASVFGIDCLTYAIMSNHIHLVLRSRPDVVGTWSDEEVARRWLRLFPKRREKDGSPAEPTEAEIDFLVNQPDVLAERRRRLSDISWWMRCTTEHIARSANREDRCTGHFWEGRYKCQLLLDEASLLACAAYVDLNPVRAAMAETPEASCYTGAKDRVDDLQAREAAERQGKRHGIERNRPGRKSGWLSPVEAAESSDTVGPDVCGSGRRASRKGFLPMSLPDYLELLDWTGRQVRTDKRGSIPEHLSPILTRIGLDAPQWCELVKDFGRTFKRVAGTAAHLSEEARRRGRRWLQAPGNPLTVAS